MTSLQTNVPIVFGLDGIRIKVRDEIIATVIPGREEQAAIMANALMPEHEPCTVIYQNWKGETARRIFVPKRWRYGTQEPWHMTPGWLLDAYDLEKLAMRTFAQRGFMTSVIAMGEEDDRSAPWMFRSPEQIRHDHDRAMEVNYVWDSDGVTTAVFHIEDYLAAGGARLGPIGDWYLMLRGKKHDDLTEKQREKLDVAQEKILGSWNEDVTVYTFPDDVLKRKPKAYDLLVIVELERPL